MFLPSINKKEQINCNIAIEERPQARLLTPYKSQPEQETITAETETPVVQINHEIIVNDSIICAENETTEKVRETCQDTTKLIADKTYLQIDTTGSPTEETSYLDTSEFFSEDITYEAADSYIELDLVEYEPPEYYTEEDIVCEDETIWTEPEGGVFVEETVWTEPTEEDFSDPADFDADYIEYNGFEEETYSNLGQDIVNYALSWVGVTPYVETNNRLAEDGYWNDLYEGTDCTGFTHLIYSAFGIWVPYSSDDYQYNVGISIAYEELQPGDIVVYRYGGHVGSYVGDDLIVHCSNPSSGTIVSSMWYSTPTNFVRVVY